MRRLALLLLILAGCGTNIADQPAAEEAKPDPAKPVQRVALDDLAFVRSSHKSLLTGAANAARQIADESWEHEPFRTRRESYLIETHWDSGGPGTPTEKFAKRGNHAIRLAAYRHPNDPTDVLGVRVSASWRPKKSGWGAHVAYFDDSPRLSYSYKPDSFRLTFRWHPDGKFDYVSPSFEIYPSVARLSMTKQLDNTEYNIDVWTTTPPSERTQVDNQTVLRWLASAESMRDEALSNLDSLAERAAEEIRSGVAVRRASITNGGPDRPPGVGLLPPGTSHLASTWVADGGSRAIPPPRSSRVLSESEKRQILEQANAEIDRRRQMVEQNYPVWFAALAEAFPLKECLTSCMAGTE